MSESLPPEGPRGIALRARVRGTGIARRSGFGRGKSPRISHMADSWVFSVELLDPGKFQVIFMVSTVQHRAPSPGWRPQVVEGARNDQVRPGNWLPWLRVTVCALHRVQTPALIKLPHSVRSQRFGPRISDRSVSLFVRTPDRTPTVTEPRPSGRGS